MASPRDLERLTGAFAALEVLNGLPEHRAYERLAALVLERWLDEPAVHDVTLTGQTGAPHQIDVVVGDERRRALVECKFYGRRIDLPIVRNFFGQVDDLGCDLAAIVTTVGYSRNAETYARGKSIDLLVLRPTREEDLEGRIREAHLEIVAVSAQCTGLTVEPIAAADAEWSLSADIGSPDTVLEFADGSKRPLRDRWKELDGAFTVATPDGVYPIVDEFQGAPVLVVEGHRIPVRRIGWEFTVARDHTVSVAKHEPLVTLVSADGGVLSVSSARQLTRLQAYRAWADSSGEHL